MKRSRILALALIFGLATICSWVGVAKAQLITSQVNRNQSIDGSVYAAGEHVRIDGLVNGDVHCAGQNVVVSGTVKGDVLCAGNEVIISGTVEGSVRAAAQTMKITGSIGHGASLAASKLEIAKTAKIGEDATIASSDAQLHGTIGRDAVITASRLQTYGTIGRTLTAHGETIKLENGTHVAGNVRYTSDKSITIADNATVKGAVKHVPASESRRGPITGGFVLIMFLAMLFFSLLLVLVWPQLVHTTSDIAVRSLGKTMLVGALATFAVPLLIAAFAVSVIGLPVAIFMLIAACIIGILSGPIAAYYLGSMLLAKSKNPIAIMLMGSVVLLIAYMIPVVSVCAIIVAYLIGTGALLLKIKQITPTPVYRVDA